MAAQAVQTTREGFVTATAKGQNLLHKPLFKITRDHDILALLPEGFIFMRLEAGGPQDPLDVEALLSNSPIGIGSC